jgi:hypothetical protein
MPVLVSPVKEFAGADTEPKAVNTFAKVGVDVVAIL